MDVTRLTQAKAYQKIRQRLSLFHLALSPALLALAVYLPISSAFKEKAVSLTAQPFGIIALYFLFFSLWMLIFDLPLSFYSGYVLERRFGLSNHTFGSWAKDLLKRSLLSFGFSLVLLTFLYAIIWRSPQRWWFWAWLGFAAVTYVMGKIFPVLIVPIFYKYSRVENPSLVERIFKLAGRFGLPLENVYSLNLSRTTKKANAAFMGMGKTKRVVLSDTLLGGFSDDEIEMVLAHELGHFKHRDIWKQLGLGLAASFFAFWTASRVTDGWARSLRYEGVGDAAAMPLIFLVFYLVYLVLTPLQNGFSRWVEKEADRFALRAFPSPGVFIASMEKLADLNLSDPEPNPFYEWFFYDHPAIAKRIQMAKDSFK